MDNKYKVGEVVYAKTNLTQKLIITSYLSRIYYCHVQGDVNQKGFAYFEREILPESAVVNK